MRFLPRDGLIPGSPKVHPTPADENVGVPRLEARQECDQIVISIADDRAGIDSDPIGRNAVDLAGWLAISQHLASVSRKASA
jgi:hypothetical protein